MAHHLRLAAGQGRTPVGRRLQQVAGVVGEVLGEERVGVEEEGGHLHLVAVPRPLVTGTVDVQLDAVALRVVQVEGLRDQVVTAAGVQVGGARRHGREDGGQHARVRVQQRGVEEARAAPLPLRQVGTVPQHDEFLAAAAEADRARALAHRLEEQDVGVEPRHEVEVGDVERHLGHPGVRRKLLGHCFLLLVDHSTTSAAEVFLGWFTGFVNEDHRRRGLSREQARNRDPTGRHMTAHSLISPKHCGLATFPGGAAARSGPYPVAHAGLQSRVVTWRSSCSAPEPPTASPIRSAAAPPAPTTGSAANSAPPPPS